MNLAVEEFMLDSIESDGFILMLYVNRKAVIIGRNQNPWKECDIISMKRDGVQLVRRMSGGGAVYHDTGNLNFSFISSTGRYDSEREDEMLLSVLRNLGINAQPAGRNDLCVEGRKFSGNAWRIKGCSRMRHGTLLADSDLSALEKYLTPRISKLEMHGVESVRSRVCNLSEYAPEITVDSLAAEFKRSANGYTEYLFSEQDQLVIDRLYKRNASDDWNYGKAVDFEYTAERRYEWGNAEICLNVDHGIISEIKVYTDSMDTGIAEKIERRLLGMNFDPDAI